MLILELRTAMAAGRTKNVTLAKEIGVRPETVSRIFSGDKRFTNGHVVTLMRLFPRLTSYCYEYMKESGEIQNARRDQSIPDEGGELVSVGGPLGNNAVTA